MAIDFSTFLSVAPHILNSRLPILIRGRHGVGKSEVVYQIAAARSLPVVERRASQMTEGDLLGLPDSTDLADGRRATTWNAPDWLVEACTRAVVLFLDEVDRATMEVRQGLFELTDSRKINGWRLHPDTLIIAAVNGGEHGAQYQVGEMDPAELDRWTVFDIEPSVEDWLGWAKDNVHTLVWDFINHNRAHLEHTDDFEPNKVYPSRRSWKRYNDVGVSAGLFEEGADLLTIYHLANSFLGSEAAAAFRDFAVNYSFAVTVEQIIDNGEFDKMKNWTITDQLAMTEKMLASDRFKSNMSEQNIKNLATFWNMIEGEVAMAFHQKLAGYGKEENIGQKLVIDFHEHIVERFMRLVGEGLASE